MIMENADSKLAPISKTRLSLRIL